MSLETLRRLFQYPPAQQALLHLYADSQSDCKKNGKCGPEVGMAREKDLLAVLRYFLKERITTEISNDLPEDFLMDTEKVSVKHSQGAVGSAVKAKWTSDKDSTASDITSIISAEDGYYPHLLLIYMPKGQKKIVIACVEKDKHRTVVKTLKEGAFKILNGNSRGFEYSKAAMKEFLSSPAFICEIQNVDLEGGMDPIQKRMKQLELYGIPPTLPLE